MTILNPAATTIAVALASILHRLKVTVPVAVATYLSSAALTTGVTGVTLVLTRRGQPGEASLTVSVLSILLAGASPILFPQMSCQSGPSPN